MKISVAALGLLFLLGLTAWSSRPDRLPLVEPTDTVQETLRALNQPERADLQIGAAPGASVALGRRLVLEGVGEGGGQQSAHFKCTSCHNVVREDPVLTEFDPEARLKYVEKRGLPFLPGTTLWGAVDRESYYNNDYDKKYGDLVKPARRDLRKAIQLCATECAQGKALTDTEMSSVVRYLLSIGVKLSDLEGTPAPASAQINAAIASGNQAQMDTVAAQIKHAYALASPAHFVEPPENRLKGYEVVTGPNLESGRAIYELGCLHCHEDQRYSFFELNRTERDYRFLTKHFPQYTRYSTYQVSRYGTQPIPGKRAYMPHYTAERMSDRQLEDLRAYLAQAAAK